MLLHEAEVRVQFCVNSEREGSPIGIGGGGFEACGVREAWGVARIDGS
jgi:hypothetical protein